MLYFFYTRREVGAAPELVHEGLPGLGLMVLLTQLLD